MNDTMQASFSKDIGNQIRFREEVNDHAVTHGRQNIFVKGLVKAGRHLYICSYAKI